MPSDVELYEANPEEYNRVQYLRPDYSAAINKTVELASRYLERKQNVAVADFCGGTGTLLRKLTGKKEIASALIIDINKEFLEIAQNSLIKIADLKTICCDIIKAHLEPQYDLIFAVFAYHHVPDNQKENFLKIALEGLKPDGVIILTEIYSPDKEETLKYYQKLLSEISEKNEFLEKFLLETADSNNFEFKVPKQFADNQIRMLGLREVEKIKIWPIDKTFDENIGAFVQVLRK